MKKTKLKLLFPLILIIISFTVGSYVYKLLPDTIVTHWGIKGEPNGYSSKAFGVFFLPVLLVFFLVLFSVLPKIDPYKTNFSQFKNYFQNFINIIFGFLFYIYVLSLIWNLGIEFSLIQFMIPGFAIVFYYAGILMQNAKKNWFVGIRTPWTMSSDIVWSKTHKVGGNLFKLVALISLLGIILPQFAFFFILVPILSVTLFVFVYSYLEYKKFS